MNEKLQAKKQKLKELLEKLKEWSKHSGNDDLDAICKDLEDEVETMDEGSNPSGPPPPPPGGGG